MVNLLQIWVIFLLTCYSCLWFVCVVVSQCPTNTYLSLFPQLFKRRNVCVPSGDESMLECPIQDPDISSTAPVSGVSDYYSNCPIVLLSWSTLCTVGLVTCWKTMPLLHKISANNFGGNRRFWNPWLLKSLLSSIQKKTRVFSFRINLWLKLDDGH